MEEVIHPKVDLDNPFTEDYFIRGAECGLSNYKDYMFLEELTHQYAANLITHLGIKRGESIHDIGCARGYLVKVLNDLGRPTTGHDISEWAIKNCHPHVMDEVSLECSYTPQSVDWVHSKDCAEHWLEWDLQATLPKIMGMARKGCLFIVPLVHSWGGRYLYPPDNMDKTHKIRFTLESWMRLLVESAGRADGQFTVHGSYHLHGLKRASESHPFSTGFLTVRRFIP